ncbi:hypothetical protein JTB14_027975 [Gonioctena quinquepunctata]|nr:hypothetical protein JTB14_027975 [Gonioctena quinquepunctata]
MCQRVVVIYKERQASRNSKKDIFDLLAFRAYVAEALMEADKPPVMKRKGRPSSEQNYGVRPQLHQKDLELKPDQSQMLDLITLDTSRLLMANLMHRGVKILNAKGKVALCV